MLEAALRAARIYDSDSVSGQAWLVARVGAAGNAASVRLSFRRVLQDPDTGGSVIGTTWERAAVLQNYDAGEVVGVVRELLDEFVSAYLRVNESACGA